MSFICRKIILFTFSSLIFIGVNGQDLKINEVMSSNRDIIFDEDGDYPDWIELINFGNETLNLQNYFLSDNSDELSKWQLPEILLAPDQPVLFFASDKNRPEIPSIWYTLIDYGDNWKYLIPENELPADWKSINFDDENWNTGATGIGYGDNDDSTLIASNTISVFIRRKFEVISQEMIKSVLLHLDYDDAFVAYLNGVEIARSGIGQKGDFVPFNKVSDIDHEAKIYMGEKPEEFDISELKNILNNGENVLAIQVHNASSNSSDLTVIPFFTLGYFGSIELDEPVSDYISLTSNYSHTNFKLSSKGETVLLSDSQNNIIDSVTFSVIPSGFSYGRDRSEIQKWGFLSSPTPGFVNSSELFKEKVESEVEFSLLETFLDSEKELILNGSGFDEEIRYTLNSDAPTVNSKLYSSPLTISENIVVRARIFKEGSVPGKISSKTYIFDEPPTLPVVSVVTDSINLWGNETGIYILGDDYEEEMPHRGANYWEDWEKPAGIEMIDTLGNQLFSANCGIKMFGGWSRAQDQKSLAVFFRNEYGDSEIKNVQLFNSKPIDEFSSFVLRNAGNDHGFGHMRDGMMTSLVRNLNTDISAYQPTIMYLNGTYWGIINLREKINEDYLESNHGVDTDQVDLMEWNGSVIEGSSEKYWELIGFLESTDITLIENYENAQNLIDIENFIDYQLSQIYFNNRDWPGNNIKYWRPQTEAGKLRWIMFDTDFGFSIYVPTDYELNTLEFALATDGQDWPNPPWSTFIFRKLLENTTFRNGFINRYADILNTTFRPDFVINHIDSLANNIRPEIQRHWEKWNSPWPGWWEENVQRMRDFASYRVDYTRAHLKQQFELTSDYEVSLSILPSTGGIIKLNTIDISTANWQGRYFEGIPITLTANANIGYKFYSWSIDGATFKNKTITADLEKATSIRVIFEDSDDDGNSIVFNEINYNSPEENNAGDWVELYNWGRKDLNISSWIFKDNDDTHSFDIPQNTVLKSNDYIVLCRDIDDFRDTHPEVSKYIGEFDFGLSSSGDAVRLFTGNGELVDEVTFGSTAPWPTNPNGNGSTLEFRHISRDNSKAENWKSSVVNLGTPGRENSVTTNVEFLMATNSEKKLIVYPNPFNTETKIKIENGGFEPLEIRIYSMDGRLIYDDTNGSGEFVWDGKNKSGQKVLPGIYICKVQSEGDFYTAKIILTR